MSSGIENAGWMASSAVGPVARDSLTSLVYNNLRQALMEGRFWPGKATHEQFKLGVAQFIEEHFGHGEVVVMGDDPYERYLDSCPTNEWPVTFYIEATHDGRIKFVELPSAMRG